LGDEELAEAYVARGVARAGLGEHAAALADLNAAVRLRPFKGSVLAARGSAHLRAGNLALAEADLTRALSLAADSSSTYLRRGHARFLSGRYAEALDDFRNAERSNDLGLNREFIAIWQALAELRLGKDPAPRLAERLKGGEGKRWPGAVLRLLAGKARGDEVLQEAADGTPDEQAANLCEAYFYLGQLALAKGDKAGAAGWFRKSVDTGVLTYMEYEMSLESLRALR
jgi:lipoprotein NlpI